MVLLEADRLSAGDWPVCNWFFDSPVCAVSGDRFIARDAQAACTIGGGVVLDPYAPSCKRRSVDRLRYLGALERMVDGAGIAPLLE
jgi:selenocysteine-specific elongation factor